MSNFYFKTTALVLLLAGVTSITMFNNANSDEEGHLTKSDVQKIVADYISDNPKAIFESVVKFQQEEASKRNEESLKKVREKKSEIEDSNTAPTMGNPKGDITVVEFFDYNCPFCKRALPNILKLLDEDKNVKIVLREYPVMAPSSELSSKFALAVNKIDSSKYIDFHTALMKGRARDKNSILALAKSQGIDTEKLTKLVDSPEIQEQIDYNKQLGSSVGISGVPAFVIAGELIPGGAIDINAMKEIIKKARDSK